MSVREEDRQRNCPSRGLGIAAAAIGVGVGAALYYFFNKRTENPDASGSTSNWTYDEPQALRDSFSDDSASMSDRNSWMQNLNYDADTSSNSDQTNPITTSAVDVEESDSDVDVEEVDVSYITVSAYTTSDTSLDDTAEPNTTNTISSGDDNLDHSSELDSSDMNSDGWESIRLPPDSLDHLTLNRLSLGNVAELGDTSRERSWTLEECSICFEGMLKEHEVMALSCSHRFHQNCIMPWLQERATCPNCRKIA